MSLSLILMHPCRLARTTTIKVAPMKLNSHSNQPQQMTGAQITVARYEQRSSCHLWGPRGDEGVLTGEEGRSGLPPKPSGSSSSGILLLILSTPANKLAGMGASSHSQAGKKPCMEIQKGG